MPISSRQLDLLVLACDLHTDGLTSDEPTVGRCWDADRLHLPRDGITPRPDLFSTNRARLEPPPTPLVPPTWEELLATARAPA